MVLWLLVLTGRGSSSQVGHQDWDALLHSEPETSSSEVTNGLDSLCFWLDNELEKFSVACHP